MFKVYIQNVRSIGTRCGFGEGKTHSEAIQDALRMAQQNYPNKDYPPRYDEQTHQVLVSAGTCL